MVGRGMWWAMSNDRTIEQLWATVAAERRRLADDLDALSGDQWVKPSQCEGWSIEALVAHLITPFEVSIPRFALAMIKNRGDIDGAMVDLAERVAVRNSRTQMVAKLREAAESRWTPPRHGPETVLVEIIVHGQDIRRRLGIACPVPDETIDWALDTVSDEAARADYRARIGTPSP